MTNPHGFLEVKRCERPLRPVLERLADYEDIHQPASKRLVMSQANRCMGCGVPFCHSSCPLGNLIPDWNDLVRQADWLAAWRKLDATNNFPEFTGALCPAPCEDACVLSINDEPVTIKTIELAIVDRAFAEGWVKPSAPQSRTGQSVAIVGSGPAGLAAAQQLRRAGHDVEVYERDDRAGGLLRFGIPDYKQPKAVIDRRLEQLAAEGVRFQLGVEIGRVPSLDDLRAEHNAVVLATGAQAHRELPLPGRELRNIHFAMSYLKQRNRQIAGLTMMSDEEVISAAGRRVAIIGAGDTSADCLGNVLREGATTVYEIGHGPEPPVEAKTSATWPDRPFLLREYPVHAEGGKRVWQWEPSAFVGRGHVTELHGTRMDYQEIDSADARRPSQRKNGVAGESSVLEVDMVLLAIGFSGVERDTPLFEAAPFGLTSRNTVETKAHATSIDGIFAAGDCVHGADLIVTAIADGRECARDVDRYLRGWTQLPSRDAVRLSHVAANPM